MAKIHELCPSCKAHQSKICQKEFVAAIIRKLTNNIIALNTMRNDPTNAWIAHRLAGFITSRTTKLDTAQSQLIKITQTCTRR